MDNYKRELREITFALNEIVRALHALHALHDPGKDTFCGALMTDQGTIEIKKTREQMELDV